MISGTGILVISSTLFILLFIAFCSNDIKDTIKIHRIEKCLEILKNHDYQLLESMEEPINSNEWHVHRCLQCAIVVLEYFLKHDQWLENFEYNFEQAYKKTLEVYLYGDEEPQFRCSYDVVIY